MAPWTPPRLAFPIVWSYLYFSMGYASYTVWNIGGGFYGPAQKGLILYAMKLAAVWAYTPIAFGKSPNLLYVRFCLQF